MLSSKWLKKFTRENLNLKFAGQLNLFPKEKAKTDSSTFGLS